MKKWTILLTSVLTGLIATRAGAADTYWQVPSGDWSIGSNWNNGEPTGGYYAYINNAGTAQVTEDDEACDYLYLGDGPTDSGTLDIISGSLSIGTKGYVGYSGTGTFTQAGGTNTVTNDLYLATQAGSSGTYSLSGGQVSAVYEYIGNAGTGTFTQTGGTNTASNFLYLGSWAGSSGSYALSGTGQVGAKWEYIGEYGTGTFTQTSGTHTIERDLRLGDYANSSGTYSLSGTGQLSARNERVGNDGTGMFTQTGGTNTIGNYLTVGNGGIYELSGTGQLSATFENIYGTFTQTGGTHTVIGELAFPGFGMGLRGGGTYELGGGTLTAVTIVVGLNGSGTLNIINAAANITISDLLSFRADSTFTAVPGSIIHMTGSAFENENTDPTDLTGLYCLELIFEGGSEDIDPFEVAGEDMGSVIDGWTENFAPGTLTLGGADIGKLQLVDDFDNQPGWVGSEALYVNTLNIGAGSYLDLNGYNLYYLEGEIEPTATIISNGGNLIHLSILPGDTDGDGNVDGNDLSNIINNWGITGSHGQGDLNGNGVVDGPDYTEVLSYWNPAPPEPPSQATPEPATLGLLLLGGLALLRRRRSS